MPKLTPNPIPFVRAELLKSMQHSNSVAALHKALSRPSPSVSLAKVHRRLVGLLASSK